MRINLRDLSESEELEAETLNFIKIAPEKSASSGWHTCYYSLECVYLNYRFLVLLEEYKCQSEKKLSWKVIAKGIDDYEKLLDEFANEDCDLSNVKLPDVISLKYLQHLCYSYFLKAEKIRDAKNKLNLEKMLKDFNNLESKLDRLNERFDGVFRE